MALKRTTILKRQIAKRMKLIDASTRQLLNDLSEVTDGAGIFFKETMPQHNVKVMWSDVEMTANDEVVIKGIIAANNEQFHAANVMVIRIPLAMAATSDARAIADFMIEQSGKHKANAEQAPAPTPEAAPATAPATEFDLSQLDEEQRKALELYNISRGGKL